MSVQQFCLRWNNHQPNFVSVFTSLLSNESLVDVTLAAEGKHLQAHRVVLSACSSYFQTLFSVNPCQHPIVILKDVKYNDLKTMVDFMYYGEVNVSQEQLPAILKTAETLKIKGLAEMPEHSMHLSKSLSTSSDKTDAPVPGDSNWSLDTGCRSASPMSPSVRRKRLRKTSTGSGSGSAERTSEEITNEITLISSPIVKPEPAHVSEDGQHSDGSLRNTSQEASTESEPREGSRDSVEDENISVQMTRENSASAVEPAVTDSDLNPLSSQHQHSTSSQASSPNSKPSKRGRQLMRQSRIKKEMDASHTSPESEPSSPQFIASSSSLLTVPPFRIERQHSEPPPSTSPPPSSSNNLLTVPPTFLVKQMSHPLLPSQQPSSSQGTTLLMHRQSSQPAPQPLQIHLVASASQASTQETPSCASSPGIMMEQLPVLHVFPDNSDTNKSTLRPTLRVRSEELTTHTSSAQALSMRESLEPLRSVHCPVLRPGPALGCNFCWNTIDGHGRILRRKTKYHCPECQTNLCIVPCFQEYHERQTITESKDHSGTTSPTVMKMLPKTSSI